jgi:phage baseplate assembly protein W
MVFYLVFHLHLWLVVVVFHTIHPAITVVILCDVRRATVRHAARCSLYSMYCYIVQSLTTV